MNPIHVADQLKHAFVNYLLTTFDVNRDGHNADLAAELRSIFESDGALFNGPFLELTPPYVRGLCIRDLVNEGVLDSRRLKLPCFQNGLPLPSDAQLYRHQEQAIRRIVTEERSIVVSSGTGSGKTESFLIPILNDLIRDKSPGVRAVLIYPLNALVNDQLDRLRDLLNGTDITFGRYTSELETKTADAIKRLGGDPMPNEVISRQQIRDEGKLPQILITNYAMLEYLLLRPEDSVLFSSGRWRFLVLDEAHSYGGAKGIEVAMLIRRLKQRLNKKIGEMRCIATSATLAESTGEAVEFAHHLFGESFGEEDIILGAIDSDYARYVGEDVYTAPNDAYLNSDLEILLNDLRLEGDSIHETSVTTDRIALTLSECKLLDDQALSYADEYRRSPNIFLWEVMRRNQHVRHLVDWMLEHGDQPVTLEEAATEVFGSDMERDERLPALYRLIELGTHAKPSAGAAPLLPARYHFFARAPQGVWACVNPTCPGRHPDQTSIWSKLFTAPHNTCDSCGKATYALAVCRTCGQVYLKASVHNDDSRKLLTETDLTDQVFRYLSLSPIEENISLLEEDDESEVNSVSTSTFEFEVVELCLNDECRRIDKRCHCTEPNLVSLYLVKSGGTKGRRGISEPVAFMDECPRCHDRPRVKNSEIATSITLGGSAPISVLTTELYRQLPPSSKPEVRQKPGQERKLLAFYDSRQGAARFASYLQDVFNQDVYRYLVPEAVRRHQNADRPYPLDLENLIATCFHIGWDELNVFQNDLEFMDIVGGSRTLSRNQRERVTARVAGYILSEITTRQRSRQSLEALGLLRVSYFETPPDVVSLATSIELTPGQTFTLIEQLLDTIRREKAITMPDGVDADDNRFFGRHKGHAAISKSRAQQGETPWIGTSRHRRHRLVESALRQLGQHAEEGSVQTTLSAIWDWLHEYTDVFTGSVHDGFRLSHNRLFFTSPKEGWLRCTRCQRLSYGTGDLPCPYPDCGGDLKPINREGVFTDNYYHYVMTQPVIPMRVEEHTAQLDPDKGRDYQEEFKEGTINLLSCSTTFEMGIDLGDLQAVVLNNVPPSVSNYRQRSGRAGRRAGGTAFILTWAPDRPHDQLYYSDPTGIIRGHVRVPRISLKNDEIRTRHLNAILLGNFLRDLYQRDGSTIREVGQFFEPQTAAGPVIEQLSPWIADNERQLRELVQGFAYYFDGDVTLDSVAVVRAFTEKVQQLHNKY